jgi:hypothetical protein
MALTEIGKAAYIIVGIEADKSGKRIKEADQVKAHENVLDRFENLTFIGSGGSWKDPVTGKVIVENGRIYLHIGATFIESTFGTHTTRPLACWSGTTTGISASNRGSVSRVNPEIGCREAAGWGSQRETVGAGRVRLP